MSMFSQNTNVLLFTISVCMNADLHEIGQFVMVLPLPDIIHINGVYKFYHCSQGLQGLNVIVDCCFHKLMMMVGK